VESEAEDETPSMSPDELFIEYGGEVAEALIASCRADDLV
jgi:hypothetical protein